DLRRDLTVAGLYYPVGRATVRSLLKSAPMMLMLAAAGVTLAVTPAPGDDPASANVQEKQPQKKDAGMWKASGKRGAVAAGGQGAVDAGMTLLQAEGNAVDAAVATILALSVTDFGSFCFGGEVPIMVYDAKRDTVEVL